MTSFMMLQALAANWKGGQVQRWQEEGATKVGKTTLEKIREETHKSIAFRTSLYTIIPQLAQLNRHNKLQLCTRPSLRLGGVCEIWYCPVQFHRNKRCIN